MPARRADWGPAMMSPRTGLWASPSPSRRPPSRSTASFHLASWFALAIGFGAAFADRSTTLAYLLSPEQVRARLEAIVQRIAASEALVFSFAQPNRQARPPNVQLSLQASCSVGGTSVAGGWLAVAGWQGTSSWLRVMMRSQEIDG